MPNLLAMSFEGELAPSVTRTARRKTMLLAMVFVMTSVGCAADPVHVTDECVPAGPPTLLRPTAGDAGPGLGGA